MKIRKLAKSLNLKANQIKNIVDFEVKGVSCNSKQVSANFVFVAINGAKDNGNKFIDEAIKRGAKLIISQAKDHRSKTRDFLVVKDARKALGKLANEFYGRPSRRIKVIGVTGTNGKTTITYLIEAILKKAKFNPAVIGTINYRFNDKIITSKNTTPGPLDIQSMLSQMLKYRVTHCIMEVSSHALDQDRAEGINFHSAIFTNLTQDHLDYHKTINNYFKSKLKLFKNLSSNAYAIINNDDSYSSKIKKATLAKVITYGIKRKAQIMAEEISFNSAETVFVLVTPKARIKLKTKLIGLHNVYNVLAAASWAWAADLKMNTIKSALEEFSSVPGRLERVGQSGNFSIFVDYAHTEDALKNILQALRPIAEKKIIVVFGCGGERDKGKRPKMGNIVSRLADYAIITSDNPRSEDPRDIIEDIKRGIERDNYCVVPERLQAINKSLLMAQKGDIVVVAGKGHENYQVLKDKIVHFDDRQVIKECLKSLNY